MHTISMGAREVEQHSPQLYILRPRAPMSTRPPRSPSVVLLFGWMNAEFRHVYKYAQSYERLLPHAHIIVMLSTFRSCFVSTKAEWTATAAQLDAQLHAIGQTVLDEAPDSVPQALVHCFSNGGMIQSCAMLAHTERRALPTAHEPLGVVMDCVPGYPSTDTLRRAAMVGVSPKGWRGALERKSMELAVWLVQGVRNVAYYLGQRDMDAIAWAKRLVNERALWLWRRDHAAPAKLPPRLYLHSRADEFIEDASVAEHAAAAQEVNREPPPAVWEAEGQSGEPEWPALSEVRTRRVVWDTLPHCQLARYAPALYWDTVSSYLEAIRALPTERVPSRL